TRRGPVPVIGSLGSPTRVAHGTHQLEPRGSREYGRLGAARACGHAAFGSTVPQVQRAQGSSPFLTRRTEGSSGGLSAGSVATSDAPWQLISPQDHDVRLVVCDMDGTLLTETG